MNIRPENKDDKVDIFNLNNHAFGRNNEALLIEKLRDSDRYLPELSLVAELEGNIVGHILFSKVLVGEHVLLALAPLALIPGKQRNGIENELMKYGIQKAKDLGYIAIIALGNPYKYKAYGFSKASKYGLLAPWDEIPDEAFMALELQENALDHINGKVDYGKIFNESN